jgi:hypothetical protein
MGIGRVMRTCDTRQHKTQIRTVQNNSDLLCFRRHANNFSAVPATFSFENGIHVYNNFSARTTECHSDAIE